MNAPIAPQAVQTSELQLADITPSTTHIQELRRARFDPAKLQELADSVKNLGVVQAIVVRPSQAHNGYAKFELVAGERRFLAAQLAGLTTIPATVRDFTDEQVLEVQLVENLQRSDLHELEEAEGYDELMKLKKISADDVASMVGKSRAYVYARIKLLALDIDARKAFYAGELDASRALYVARVKNPKLQVKALKIATEKGYKGDRLYSVRSLREQLTGNGFSVPLDRAPFAQDDQTFFELVSIKKGVSEPRSLPDCISCPNRTGNCLDLFSQDDDPDVCTEPACYDVKLKQHGERTRKLAEASGITVITGEEAKLIAPKKGELVGYVDLDEVCPDDEPDDDGAPEYPDDDGDPVVMEAYRKAEQAWNQKEAAYKPRTFRQLLEGVKVTPVVIEDPRTQQIRTLVDYTEAAKAIKKLHKFELNDWRYGAPRTITRPSESAADKEARLRKEEAQRARQEEESRFRRALLAQVTLKGTGPLKHDDLCLLAEKMLDDYNIAQDAEEFFGKEPKPGNMKEPELLALVRTLTVLDCLSIHTSPKSLLDVAKRLKIDPDKIKKDLKAAAKAADKPAKAPAAKKAKKA
jgi:ParB/RepB/Spo0J family partition protein